MKCIWCDRETTTNEDKQTKTIALADKEHIFPESVGGKRTLALGKVCKDCNNRLGTEVDCHLRSENFMMLKHYQDAMHIHDAPIGKVRGKKDRVRKLAERDKVQGYGKGFTIQRQPEKITLKNLPSVSGGDVTYNEKFSRALHKCAVNVLLSVYEYDFLKSEFNELIEFVNSGSADYREWSYGLAYANLASFVDFEPFCIQEIMVEGIPIALTIAFPGLLAIVGLKPCTVVPELLAEVGNNPASMQNWEANNFDYIDHYTDTFANDGRKTFGEKLKFTFLKKHLLGTPDPSGDFYLLIECNICGQITPTSIMLDRKKYISQELTGGITSRGTEWNVRTDEDLAIQGLRVEKWDAKSLEKYRRQPFQYAPEHDVTKLNIRNCRCNCINCGCILNWSAENAFI